MTYQVKRWMGYQPWGVTNPWVFANYGQPQRHRGYVSPIVFQTEPPKLVSQHLGSFGQLVAPAPAPATDDATARAARMETLAITGLCLSAASLAIYVWTVHKMMKKNGRKSRRGVRRNESRLWWCVREHGNGERNFSCHATRGAADRAARRNWKTATHGARRHVVAVWAESPSVRP